MAKKVLLAALAVLALPGVALACPHASKVEETLQVHGITAPTVTCKAVGQQANNELGQDGGWILSASGDGVHTTVYVLNSNGATTLGLVQAQASYWVGTTSGAAQESGGVYTVTGATGQAQVYTYGVTPFRRSGRIYDTIVLVVAETSERLASAK